MGRAGRCNASKIQTVYKGKQMLSLSAVRKELENPNNSETVKLLCKDFLLQRTLYWGKSSDQEYMLFCAAAVFAKINVYRSDKEVYYANNHINNVTNKFASLAEAVGFLTNSFEEMDFIVLPPDFEV